MRNFTFPLLALSVFLLISSIASATPTSTLAKKSSSAVVESKKEEQKSFFKKLFSKKKIFKRASKKSKNGTVLAEFLGVTLTVLVAALLLMGVGFLAFYLAWFEMMVLAIIVLIVGAASVIFGAIKVMKSIFRGNRKN